MNSEHYSDPTADKAIGNVMQEWRRKKKYGKERVCIDESGKTSGVRSKGRTCKERSHEKKERNARNA